MEEYLRMAIIWGEDTFYDAKHAASLHCELKVFASLRVTITMAQKNDKTPARKKKSQSFASMLFDVVGYGVRQAALPVPDMPKWMKKKKEKDLKKK